MATTMSLGGEPLLYDKDSQVAEYLRKFHPLEDLVIQTDESIHRTNGRSDTRGLADVNLPLPNYPDPPPPRINQLYWPTGATRWARGYLLCHQATLAKLNSVVGDNTQSLLFIASNEFGSISTRLFLLSPRLIGGGSAPLYLLPVVDERYWWQWANIGDFGKPQVGTWSALFTHLLDSLPIAGSTAVGTIAAAYLEPDDDEFTRRYDNAAVMLDAAAHSVGMRVVRDLDGTVRVISAADSTTRGDANVVGASDPDWVVVSGDSTGVRAKTVPHSVDVLFPRALCKVPDCTSRVYEKNETAASYKHATQTAVAGTKHEIHSTLWADYNTSADMDANNKADCDALAAQAAGDYYAWLAVPRYDVTYAGIKSWLLSGQDDHLLFSFNCDRPETYCGAVEMTRIQPLPENFAVSHQLSNDVAIRVPEGLIAVKLMPNETLTANGNAQAYQMTWSGSDWVADSNCTVTVYDPFGWSDFDDEEEFWVRRGCDSGRLEAINGPGGGGGGTGDTLHRVTAQNCFNPGGSGTFDLLQFNAGVWSDSMTDVTVHDSNGTVFLLPLESAWVVKKAGTTRYEFIPEQGLFRKVVANQNIEPGASGVCTVRDHSLDQGCDGVDTNCTVVVCNAGDDDDHSSRAILSGEWFWARYVESKWQAILSPHDHVRVQLTQQACKEPGDTAVCTIWVPLAADRPEDWVKTGHTITVYDPNGYVFMLNEEFHWAVKHRGSYYFASEHGLSRKGKTLSRIGCFEEGQVTIYEHRETTAGIQTIPPTCAGTSSSCIVLACNGSEEGSETPMPIAAEQFVNLRRYEGKWHILPPQIPEIIEVELDGTVCATDPSAPVVPREDTEYCFELPENLDNPFCLAGVAGDIVVAYRSVDENGNVKWNLLQVKHTERTLQEVRWNEATCNLEKRDIQFVAMGCTPTPASWDVLLEFELTTQEYLYNWYVDEPSLSFRGEASKIYQPVGSGCTRSLVDKLLDTGEACPDAGS